MMMRVMISMNDKHGKHGSPCNMGNKSSIDLFNDGKKDATAEQEFANSTGMEQVLDRGPWLIQDGLGLIATQIGKPLMLYAYTSSMCGEAWGRINFAHALIEVSSESDLKKEVVMAFPNDDETDYTREVISVEYKWQPPRCANYKKFGHSSDRCPKIIREPVTPVSMDINSDGFKEVQRKKIKDKKADLHPMTFYFKLFDVLNTMDVEDESGTPSSRGNQEKEREERIKELDEFDERLLMNIFFLKVDKLTSAEG
ncbi:hypothetical protein Tco_0777693 [Tanacetum coccineum]